MSLTSYRAAPSRDFYQYHSGYGGSLHLCGADVKDFFFFF